MITVKDILKAQKTISPFIKETSLIRLEDETNKYNYEIYLKLENMQNSGSFKMRGACNAIASMTEEKRKKGIIASSAGNHAQGVAFACRSFGIASTIVMPLTSPISKIKGAKEKGAEVVLYGDNYDEAYKYARKLEQSRDLVFVHPFDDDLVIAGQGTIGLEILKELPDVDAVIVPIGGGGLISGISIAIKSINPRVKVIGVQTENAPSMIESLKKGAPTSIETKMSIADGINVGTPGVKTFEIVKKYVDDIVTVSEDQIASSILLLLEKQKIASEGSGATPLAAILEDKLPSLKGKKVVCLISGGNIDINMIESVINRGLIHDGRRFTIKLVLKHKAGELQKLLKTISNAGGNIYTIEQNRYGMDLGLYEQSVEMVIEAFDPEHEEKIKFALKNNNYNFEEE